MTPEESQAHYQICPACKARIPLTNFLANLSVCTRTKCQHHHVIGAKTRIAQLIQPGTFFEWDADVRSPNPLNFPGYDVKMAQVFERTQMHSAAVTGKGRIGDRWVAIAVTDYAVMAGAMGGVVGERFTRCIEGATQEKLPLLLISGSGAGAMMQEGLISLMQMPIIVSALARHKRAGLLSICLQTQSTQGGVIASWASLAHITIAEPKAEIGFIGRKVSGMIKTIRAPLGFRTAEYQFRHGMIDMIVPRRELKGTIERILGCLPNISKKTWKGGEERVKQLLDQLPHPNCGYHHDQSGEADRISHPTGAEALQIARHLQRPSSREYIRRIFEDFVEIHGDRCLGDDPVIIAGIARIEGRGVVVIGQQKDRLHEWGMAGPAGYHKAQRAMILAQKLKIPLLCFVDTLGANSSFESEGHGISYSLAACQQEMADLTIPIIATVLGEGGSGGAVALAVANRVLMLENAVYSVIAPAGAAAILWGDAKRESEAANALGITAQDALRLGVIDRIISEPPGGAHTNPDLAAQHLKAVLVDELVRLYGKGGMAEDRYKRFRTINPKLGY